MFDFFFIIFQSFKSLVSGKVSGQCQFWQFSWLPDWTWCLVEPYLDKGSSWLTIPFNKLPWFEHGFFKEFFGSSCSHIKPNHFHTGFFLKCWREICSHFHSQHFNCLSIWFFGQLHKRLKLELKLKLKLKLALPYPLVLWIWQNLQKQW